VNIKKHIVILDFLRGIAALLVVFGHTRSMIFLDYTPTNLLFEKFFYAVTSLGHQAVILFFVLSGFFISRSVVNNDAIDKFSWFNYFVKRLTRLWCVLIPALFLTYIIDWVGIYSSLSAAVYGGYSGSSVLQKIVSDDLTFANLISNALFIPTDIIPVLGSNGSLWSLSLEFWSYILFPLIFFMNKASVTRKILYFFLIVLILYLIGVKGGVYFLIWLLGLVPVYISFSNKKNTIIFFSISVLLFSVAILAARAQIINDFVFGALIVPLIISSLNIDTSKFLFFEKVSKFLSKISFSMYAIHLPIVVLFKAILIGDQRLPFGIQSLVLFLICLILVTLSSYFFWYLFERNTNKIQNIILTNKSVFSKASKS